jgi:ubiquinone biosynthesis protein COQ9
MPTWCALPAELLATLSIRERIRRLVQFRLDALTGLEEALRRAQIEMARPRNAALSRACAGTAPT